MSVYAGRQRPVRCILACDLPAPLTGVCAAAEEMKPVSYKLRKGELDAPDPTPQRSEGQGDGEPEESDEEDNGDHAESEESSEAEQDREGADRKAEEKERDMQVHGLPRPCIAARPLHVHTPSANTR